MAPQATVQVHPLPAIGSVQGADELENRVRPALDSDRSFSSKKLKDPLTLDRELALAMAQRKRKWRSCVHLVVMMIIIGVWCIFMLPHLPLATELTYDPTEGLSIQVGSCDVDFIAGEQATISFTRLLSTGTRSTEDDTLIFDNAGGCSSMPMKSCRRLCHVKVFVPPGASGANFRVSQIDKDPSTPLIRVQPGVSFASLTLEVALMRHRPK